MKEAGPRGNIKELMDYTQIEGELYRRLPGGILSDVSPRRKER